MRFQNINETIGRTPLVQLNRLSPEHGATVWVKLESFNPLGCVKERPALYMIEAAEQAGLISPEQSLIIEPTSGNTGIGLAMVCAVKGYRLILTMPETMSIERRSILAHLGAELMLTDGTKGMNGAIARAEELASEYDGVFIPQQFRNHANVTSHRETTAAEILSDMEGLTIDAFVSGVGTGGTITGVGQVLRERFGDATRIIAVEPADSPVLSGGEPGPHKIQGIGAGFVPEILDNAVIDEIMTVTTEQAVDTARQLARREGMFVGISCGAAAYAAIEYARRSAPGRNVVTVLPDTGERYLSTVLFEDVQS
ncbi:MAG: cysteine synthase A [Bacteroidetes bacterium]|nr:cysteine synthase A [Bacteroidota bacterium]